MEVLAAQVRRSYPTVMAGELEHCLHAEMAKGCTPQLAKHPVDLEPPFEPVGRQLTNPKADGVAELPQYQRRNGGEHVERFRMWIPDKYAFTWDAAERFIKRLQGATGAVGFEIGGNSRQILIELLCQSCDAPLVEGAFKEFPDCLLTIAQGTFPAVLPPTRSARIALHDFYPPPPYHHRSTEPVELKASPYGPFALGLAGLPEDNWGFCQILLKPTAYSSNWHGNVAALTDVDFRTKELRDTMSPARYPRPPPSGSLNKMAEDIQTKAHNDKPFYAAAMRLGVWGPNAEPYLKALSSVASLIQHGTQQLRRVDGQQYLAAIGPFGVEDMLVRGLVYRPGFLVNSRELVSLVHPFSLDVLKEHRGPVATLERLSVRARELMDTEDGTPIGVCEYGDMQQPVCIPPGPRSRHTHIIGRPGMGKSMLMEAMILDDIRKGHGVAVIDPHGDMVERLLRLIGEEHVDRVIHFDPGDPVWIPLWNPLYRRPGQDIDHVADNLVSAMKGIVTHGWGERLEHFLRLAFFSLLHLPQPKLLDVADLLRKDPAEGRNVRQEILEVLTNREARRFWEKDFMSYNKADLFPPKHKLSKLLVGGGVAEMLSQPESRFDLQAIMDNRNVLLVDLSKLGTETRNTLGSFLLSMFYVASLARSGVPPEMREDFHIYCDEAHRFATDALEDTLDEARKYGVSLTLAHQHRSQFSREKIDALSSAGTTITFNVDKSDASYVAATLRGMADVDDIIGLNPRQAIARIHTDVVRFHTRPCPEIPNRNFREQIIQHSRQHYCRPIHELREQERNGPAGKAPRYRQLSAGVDANGKPMPERAHYDEFE